MSRLANLLTPENVLLNLDVANKRRLFEIIALESELRYDLTPTVTVDNAERDLRVGCRGDLSRAVEPLITDRIAVRVARRSGQIDRAARAYKDLNRIGLALVKPGGVLVSFSCSGVIDAGLFQKILFSASLEAGREAQVVERLTQASDHPVLLTFPESEYLKGLICRVA